MNSSSALILIDLQQDFCEGGSLAVPHADEIIVLANQLQREFSTVIATQDFHPANHQSFASNHQGKKIGGLILLHGEPQILWPDHCVQGTKGADFHEKLDVTQVTKIFQKGTHAEVDSYSAFFDNAGLHATGLHEYLQQKQITDLYLLGLATDYCVKFSALDAVNLGYNTFVISDACRGVELGEGDSERALLEMKQQGVEIVTMSGLRTCMVA